MSMFDDRDVNDSFDSAFDVNHDGKLDWKEQDEQDLYLANGDPGFQNNSSRDSGDGGCILGVIGFVVVIFFLILAAC